MPVVVLFSNDHSIVSLSAVELLLTPNSLRFNAIISEKSAAKLDNGRRNHLSQRTVSYATYAYGSQLDSLIFVYREKICREDCRSLEVIIVYALQSLMIDSPNWC